MEYLGVILVIVGAVFAATLAGIGSACGVGIAGEVGAGVMTEDPDRFGLVLMLQALPGTQGIYGLLIAFMAMLKVGLVGGTVTMVGWSTGLAIMFACMPIAFGGYLSAIYQGKTSAACIRMIAKQPGEAGKAVILPAMVETYAVLSLLTSILLLNGITV